MVKVALVIGINYINSHESKRLRGCIYDANRIAKLLENHLGFSNDQIHILSDENENQTIKQEIKNSMDKVKSKVTRTSDELWLYYSGHGNAIFDKNNDENDGKDSVILPSDYIENGYISDDYIHEWMKDLSCKTLLIFDSCHSGTIGDLPWKFTYREPNDMYIEKENPTQLNNSFLFTLSSSSDDQTSWETYNKGMKQSYGEFTNSFIAILENHQYKIHIVTLYALISKEFHVRQFGKHKVSQTPLLCCSTRIPDWTIEK
jgi:hypothetical protein